ncbi:M-phase inducer phosphatase, putative [Entamoeba dispar SAW760]|uniref:protein-tyrosine-phosphatase n=1 Tax=Entamoeba dispar (strain ATCC PRA-260 / SAW760) TaxID=370354 RepID=B0EU91_ENTDS|nr:M-phase inducer phosphatase, putative [Entamoeba dispar SAW760]EDR21909.1 M-phase inducer phosphatase, putative [Entamoeba dispar SAW760]|eukprot:EDR21909.1 M-phase inducer phosphatase, putative [Entamoeba dispar SAW760]
MIRGFETRISEPCPLFGSAELTSSEPQTTQVTPQKSDKSINCFDLSHSNPQRVSLVRSRSVVLTDEIIRPITPVRSSHPCSIGKISTKFFSRVGFKTLSPYDLNQLINSSKLDELFIVDVRYPYEFNGGHVRYSMNIATDVTLYKELNKLFEINHSKKIILIAYCEFSQTRAPSLLKELRHTIGNKLIDIFLVEGGYERIFEEYPSLCEGGYIQMNDPRYFEEFIYYSRIYSHSTTHHSATRKHFLQGKTLSF